jgi:hypothetical protein
LFPEPGKASLSHVGCVRSVVLDEQDSSTTPQFI